MWRPRRIGPESIRSMLDKWSDGSRWSRAGCWRPGDSSVVTRSAEQRHSARRRCCTAARQVTVTFMTALGVNHGRGKGTGIIADQDSDTRQQAGRPPRHSRGRVGHDQPADRLTCSGSGATSKTCRSSWSISNRSPCAKRASPTGSRRDPRAESRVGRAHHQRSRQQGSSPGNRSKGRRFRLPAPSTST